MKNIMDTIAEDIGKSMMDRMMQMLDDEKTLDSTESIYDEQVDWFLKDLTEYLEDEDNRKRICKHVDNLLKIVYE